MRQRLIEELSKYGVVDVFGSVAGRPVKYKADVAHDYKYMICLENDLFPGYVTEKLLDAYVSGCVPLYWGDLGSDNSINRKCFYNLKDFASVEQFASTINSLTDSEYESTFSQPFLIDPPDIEDVLNLLCEQ